MGRGEGLFLSTRMSSRFSVAVGPSRPVDAWGLPLKLIETICD